MKKLLTAIFLSATLTAPALSQYVPGPSTGGTDANITEVGGTAIDVNNGTVSAGTPRVTLASDSTGRVNIVQGNAAISATNPIAIRVSADGTNYLDATHGIYSNLLQGNAVISATNGIYSNLLQGNAALSATNGLYANILQGNAVLSATNTLPVRPSADGTNPVDSTHGLYFNQLQGNAVLSASNPAPHRISADGTNFMDATHGLYSNLLQGNAVISATNGLYANLLQGNAVISATNTLPVRLSSDGTNPVDSTHGVYANLLQGNAVLSNTNPIPVSQGSTTNANMTHITADLVATTSTTANLDSAARNLTVINGDSTAVIYVDPESGTASNTNGLRLGPGQGHTWLGMKDSITSFTYYSTASGTKTLSYTAW